MTVAKSPQFRSFEEYLAADPSDLPEGRFEYWDGALIEVMTESLFNDAIANYLYLLLIQSGIYHELVRPGRVEVAVRGRPRTRYPDLTVLDEIHLSILKKRATIPTDVPPPQLVVEVVSPGDEDSANYKRDYQEKRDQYANREIPEYWLIDPDREWVMLGSLTAGRYEFETFRGGEAIVSPMFPGLTLTAQQVLTAGRKP
jgi:Uma2 family endonuclease